MKLLRGALETGCVLLKKDENVVGDRHAWQSSVYKTVNKKVTQRVLTKEAMDCARASPVHGVNFVHMAVGLFCSIPLRTMLTGRLVNTCQFANQGDWETCEC